MRSLGFALKSALLVFVGLGTCACSWARFDDVTGNSPIVLLDKPGALKAGFGVSVATANLDDQVEVLVGGPAGVSGAALYPIGKEESPGTTSIDSSYCAGGSSPCFLSSSLAGFATATGPDHERPLCFAVGAGTVDSSGLVVRCKDATEYALPMPPAAQARLAFAFAQSQPDDFPIAADRTDKPALLASSPSARVAWFYPGASTHFSELSAPSALTDDDSFGTKLAVLSIGDGRVYAVSVPGKNEVLLWKSDGSSSSSYIGCLGGPEGFGRALASGPVTPDPDDDLAISDAVNVHVLDGRVLFGLPETTSAECGFASLPAGGLVSSFSCGSNKSLGGCAGSDFGYALAVGDLDGDGDGEVIVGAPHMTVRGQSEAGALLVFDADVPTDSAFADAKFLSSAESGDQLGHAIATPHIDGRDIIVAGAPGNGKAALFYCSALLAPGMAGARCP